jgi:hypothetical protein
LGSSNRTLGCARRASFAFSAADAGGGARATLLLPLGH